jgi:hypothetical protein
LERLTRLHIVCEFGPVRVAESGREESGAEPVDRADSFLSDREEVVLLEHPLARLRVDEVHVREDR